MATRINLKKPLYVDGTTIKAKQTKNATYLKSLGGSGTTYTFQSPLSVDGSNKVSINLGGYITTTTLNAVTENFVPKSTLGNEMRNAVEKNTSLQNAIKDATLPSIVGSGDLSVSYDNSTKQATISYSGSGGSGTTYTFGGGLEETNGDVALKVNAEHFNLGETLNLKTEVINKVNNSLLNTDTLVFTGLIRNTIPDVADQDFNDPIFDGKVVNTLGGLSTNIKNKPLPGSALPGTFASFIDSTKRGGTNNLYGSQIYIGDQSGKARLFARAVSAGSGLHTKTGRTFGDWVEFSPSNPYSNATSIRALYSDYVEIYENTTLVGDKLTINPTTFKAEKEQVDINLNFYLRPLIPKHAFLILDKQATANLPNLPDIANLRFIESGLIDINVTIKSLLDAESYGTNLTDFQRGADYFYGDEIVVINKKQSALNLLVKSPLPVLDSDGVLLNKDSNGFNPNVTFNIVPNSQLSFIFIGEATDYTNGYGYYQLT